MKLVLFGTLAVSCVLIMHSFGNLVDSAKLKERLEYLFWTLFFTAIAGALTLRIIIMDTRL